MQEGVFQQTREGRDNKDYHPNCFICSKCSKKLTLENYKRNSGKRRGRDKGKRERDTYLNSATPIQKINKTFVIHPFQES